MSITTKMRQDGKWRLIIINEEWEFASRAYLEAVHKYMLDLKERFGRLKR